MLGKRLFGLLLLAFLICCQVTAYGAIMPKDSTSFTHLYEGGALPITDYTIGVAGSPTYSSNGNILTYTTSSNSSVYWDSNSWSSQIATADGLSVEFSVKAYSSPTPGPNGSFMIIAGDGVSGDTVYLGIYPNQVAYFTTTTGSGTVISTSDNTDTFHVFRIAQEVATGSYQVWRDGIRIGIDCGGYAPVGAYTDFYFGDGASTVYGRVDIDYIRWNATGAYSPTPYYAPLDSSSFANAYEGTTRTVTGYTEYLSGSPTVSQAGSVLTYITSSGQYAYWDSNNWNSDITTDFTIECGLKFYSSPTVGDWGSFMLVAGDGPATDLVFISIYPNQVVYHTGSGTTVINADDNTDAFHVFRVAERCGTGKYQVWRDGVRIGTDIDGDASIGASRDFYWGVGSAYVYGEVDVDYVRWDPTGAYSPPFASRDSSSFTHLYEGNARPLPDYTEYTRGSPTVSQSGSILSYTTADSTQDAYWDSSSWSSEVSSTTGKTIEVSVKAYASPTPGSNGSFNIVAGDGVSGHTILLAIYPNQVEYFTTGTGTVISTADNTDTFHIFRVAQAANSSSYQVWRDGVQIGTNIGGYTPAGAYLDFYFGDGGTYVYGKVDIDYVRWDATGAYSPVAEPNSFHLNGSPFFPIGIYSYPGALPANNYWTLDYTPYLSELSGAGFNTVMCYPSTVTASYINTLMASNITSIVNIGSVCAGYRDYEANDCSGTLGALVGNIKSCSGLLGYYTVDEAYWNYAKDQQTDATLQALTSGTGNNSGNGWLHTQDTNHPMFYCEATPQTGMTSNGYNTWSSIADAFAEDSYPIRGTSVPAFPNADLTPVGLAVQHRIDTLPNRTEPVFGVIQGSSSDDDLHDGCRKPTLAEDRFMTYDAIINGAKGILWWGCEYLTLGDPQQPEDDTMWANVKALSGELASIKDPLAAGNTSTNFGLGNSSLEGILKIYNGTRYLIVANKTSSTVSGATMELQGWCPTTATVLFESRSRTITSGAFTDDFDPWAVHVYTVDVDITPPSCSVSINSGATYCTSTSVTLTLSATDSQSGVARMRFSNDNSTWSSWAAYNTSIAWTLSTGDGTKTVYAQSQDDEGNISVVATHTIILDTTAPTAGTCTPPASVTTTTISVPHSGASDGGSGLSKVELWYKKETGGTWTNSGLTDSAGSGTFTFTPSSGSGWYYFGVVAQDNAGNRSAAVSGSGNGSTIFKLWWSDGFESGNFTTGGWTTSGACSVQSTYKNSGTYAAALDSTGTLTKSYSTSGKTSIIVQYARYGRNGPSSGHFIADWSTNGSSWTNLENFTGTSAWTTQTYTLPTGANNQSGFRIRFRVTGYSSSQYAYLDDVKIIGL